MFQSQTELCGVWDEVRKHHRYLSLITASDIYGDSGRLLAGAQLLTVQAVLMCALAICYDLQVGSFLYMANIVSVSFSYCANPDVMCSCREIAALATAYTQRRCV